MRRTAYSWIAIASLIALAVSATCRVSAQPVRRGPAIQFSNAKDDTVSTNVNSLTDRRRNNLKRLEEDLNRPLQVFEGNPGLGGNLGPVRPPAGPVIQSKKIRELLDRQKNWAFETPEDAAKDNADKDAFAKTRFDEEENDQSKMSALERYYEALSRRDAGPTNRASSDLFGTRSPEDQWGIGPESADPAQTAVRSGLGQSEQGLRQLITEESNNKTVSSLGDKSFMPDLLDTKGSSSWQTRAQESRLDQFRQSLQLDLPKSTATTLPGLSPSSSTLGASFPGVSGLGTPGTTFAPPPQRSVSIPGASSFSSAGLSAAPSLSPVQTPAYSPPPPPKRAPSMFTEMPRPRF